MRWSQDSPRLARVPGFSRLSGGLSVVAYPVCGPWSHSLLGLRDPPTLTPPTLASGRGSAAWRQAQRGRGRFCGLGGGGNKEKTGPPPGAFVVLYCLKKSLRPQGLSLLICSALATPEPLKLVLWGEEFEGLRFLAGPEGREGRAGLRGPHKPGV